MAEIDREVARSQFVGREFELEHPTYDKELEFYDLVSEGKVELLETEISFEDTDIKSRGELSRNPVRNLKYHIIVTIAMLTRFCIEKGMEEREAYSLSDQYILRVDGMQDLAELKKLHRELSLDFARRMRNIAKRQVFSLPCVRAMDYICNHLHSIIRVDMVADYVGLERCYFSKLFHRETGCTVSEYIAGQKIQAAKNMLLYSEYNCGEIALCLGFASNSHFSKRFKEAEGISPGEFRKKNFRKHWNT